MGLKSSPSLALRLRDSAGFPLQPKVLSFGQNGAFSQQLSPEVEASLHLFLRCVEMWKQELVGLTVAEPEAAHEGVSELTHSMDISLDRAVTRNICGGLSQLQGVVCSEAFQAGAAGEMVLCCVHQRAPVTMETDVRGIQACYKSKLTRKTQVK